MIKNTSGIKSTQILFGNSMGRNGFVNDYIDRIKSNFKLSPSYFQVTKNNDTDTKFDVWITEVQDDEEKDGVQKKKIIMYPEQTLEYGDYINWQNEVWLTVDKSISPYYDNGNLQKVNQTFKIKASDGTIQTIYGVVSFLNRNYLDVDNGKLISIPKDSFIVKIQSNKYTKQIVESYRLIINGRVYKCIAVADMLVKNIIELKLITDLKRDSDNFTTGIADQTIQQNITTTNLSISGSTSVKVSTSSDYTIANNTNNTFTWSIVDAITNSNTTYASIVSQSTTNCTIEANTTSGKTVKLIATCNEYSSVILTLLITISAGF